MSPVPKTSESPPCPSPRKSKREKPLSLPSLPPEIQDMIYGFCGPEEIKVKVDAFGTFDGHDARLALLNKGAFGTISSLMRTCRKTRRQLQQPLIRKAILERATIVFDSRKQALFRLPQYTPGNIPSQGFLSTSLSSAYRNVRFIALMWFYEEGYDAIVGHLTPEISKQQPDDEGNDWQISNFQWNNIGGEYTESQAHLHDRVLAPVQAYLQAWIPNIFNRNLDDVAFAELVDHVFLDNDPNLMEEAMRPESWTRLANPWRGYYWGLCKQEAQKKKERKKIASNLAMRLQYKPQESWFGKALQVIFKRR